MKNISNNAKLSLDHIRRRRGCACDHGFCRQGGILARDGENVGFFNPRARYSVGIAKNFDKNDGLRVCIPSYIKI